MRKIILITGASSGIGLALAKEFAARDYDLVLTARRSELLVALKSDITLRHPQCQVLSRTLDVTDYADVFVAVAEAAAQLGQIDIVIVNAGIGGNGRVGHGHFAKHRAIIETNVLGAMATADAAVKLFRNQGFGQLVIISSVAAALGLPTSGAYGASKAAIAIYADAIRAELHYTPIKVTTIYPGYIDTAINQTIKHRPFLITAQRGAQLIANQIERGVQSATVPRIPWAFITRAVRFIPTGIIARIHRYRQKLGNP